MNKIQHTAFSFLQTAKTEEGKTPRKLSGAAKCHRCPWEWNVWRSSQQMSAGPRPGGPPASVFPSLCYVTEQSSSAGEVCSDCSARGDFDFESFYDPPNVITFVSDRPCIAPHHTDSHWLPLAPIGLFTVTLDSVDTKRQKNNQWNDIERPEWTRSRCFV